MESSNYFRRIEDVAGKIKAKGMDVYTYGSTGWQPTHEHLAGIYLNNYAGPDSCL